MLREQKREKTLEMLDFFVQILSSNGDQKKVSE